MLIIFSLVLFGFRCLGLSESAPELKKKTPVSSGEIGPNIRHSDFFIEYRRTLPNRRFTRGFAPPPPAVLFSGEAYRRVRNL